MKRTWNRREFLQVAAAGSAGVLLAPGLSGLGSATFAAGTRPSLVTLRGEGVPKDLQAAVKKLLEPLGGMSAFVKKGQTVLLKPNIGFPTPPAQRATTSPELVAAVAKEALAAGAGKVLVMDNPVRRPEACLKIVGIPEACKPLNVPVILATTEKFFIETEIPKGLVLKKAQILKEALKADVHIALPIAKSHAASGFSGALKGAMGLIMDRESFHTRFDLNQAIADLATRIRPHLTILDGLSVMADNGPSGPGTLVTCNALIAGADPVAVDSAGVALTPLYGKEVRGHNIKHLKMAAEMGLGQLSPPAEEVLSLTI